MSDTAEFPDDTGVPAVLAEYLTQIDRGEVISREAFLASHPHYAAALLDYFADVDLIEMLANNSIPTVPPSTDTPRPFGEYDLLEEIGRGGMGIVYRARERATGRLVALKMLLHGQLMTSAEVRRFHNEASTAATLRHRGIIPIYHVGELHGRLFYTMPLMEGTSLAERIDTGSIDARDAARLLLAITEAVAVAHAEAVIHRDLKPANILLDEHQVPCVADFGLARRLGEEQLSITLSGELLGTPNYMAPEQVNGRHEQVGPLTDVYALGAILYAMLVGQAPFQSESVSETLHKICAAEPPRPRQMDRRVPRDLETICLKCLEKSPHKRYPSATALAEDLRRFLAGEPLLAQPVSQIERARRWFVRNPVVGTLAIGIAMALVAGSGFSLHYARQASRREQQALANLYAADMNLAQQHIQSGAIASALSLLERHRPELSRGLAEHHRGDGRTQYSEQNAPVPPSENSPLNTQPAWEWRYLWHQCHGELRRFEGPTGPVYAAAFSPDGRTVAAAGAEQTVWLWETASGKVKHKLAGHTATVRDLAFAPGGNHLATVGDDCIAIIWDMTTGEQIAKLGDPARGPGVGSGKGLTTNPRPLTTIAFSADGRWIATGGDDEASVSFWNATSRAFEQSLDLGPAESVVFAPDNTKLAIAGRDGMVRVCQLGPNRLWESTANFSAHDDSVYDLTWSPDGSKLASAGADHTVKLWDATTWRALATYGPVNQSAYSVDFRPDGKRIVAAFRNEPLKVWDLDRPDQPIQLRGHVGLVTRAVYDPRGWRIVSCGEDGTIRLWDAQHESNHNVQHAHSGFVRSVAFSPNGRFLASSGDDGAIMLWDSLTGRCRRVYRSSRPTTVAGDLKFLSDERLAAAAADVHLRTWDLSVGSEILDFPLSAFGVPIAMDAAPERKIAVMLSDSGQCCLVDPSTGRLLAKWDVPVGSVGSVDLTPDGTRLVTAGGDAVARVWTTDSVSLVHELNGHTRPVVKAVFHPQGSMVATSSNDHTIRLWDAVNGQWLRTLTGHSGTPIGLAFSPDGTRLASGSTDKTVKLWDVNTGFELQSLTGPAATACDVAFSPDGQHLAAAAADGSIHLWHAPLNRTPRSSDPLLSPPPRSGDPLLIPTSRPGEGPGEGLYTNPSADREAAALVRHLASRCQSQSALVAAIDADQSINKSVRAAARAQADDFQFHWELLQAGHQAAERQDWPSAVDAFQQVATLAPDDVKHWFWLAMAGHAARQHEVSKHACDQLAQRFRAGANPHDKFWKARVLLAAQSYGENTQPLRELVKCFTFPGSATYRWLHEFSTLEPEDARKGIGLLPTNLNIAAEDWYLLSLVWCTTGATDEARIAYRAAVHQSRSGTTRWDILVYREALRLQVEPLLAAPSAAPSLDARSAK